MIERRIIIIVVATVVVILIVTLVRYFTHTGVFKGKKNKDSKK